MSQVRMFKLQKYQFHHAQDGSHLLLDLHAVDQQNGQVLFLGINGESLRYRVALLWIPPRHCLKEEANDD